MGAYGVGKSSLVRRFVDGNFKDDHVATLGVEVHPLSFNTSKQSIKLNVWDVAGHEKLRSMPSGYHINASMAIIMYDCTNPNQANLTKYVEEVLDASPNAKIVFVSNKIDLLGCEDEKVVPNGMNGPLIEISSKSMHNVCNLWLHVVRCLEDDEELTLVDIN